MTRIPGKPLKFLRNSGIPQDFESVGSGILQKLQLSFLEILEFSGTQFGVVHAGGGGEGGVVDIFWNSPLESNINNLSTIGPNDLKCDEEAQCSVHHNIL